jgi:riboflavin synthase
VEEQGGNRTFWVESDLSSSLYIDQSLAHNGVCLTVEEIQGALHRVTAVEETLKKTTLGEWKEGSLVNLERSLTLQKLLDGHLVQGHVDAVGACIGREGKEGSWEFTFRYPKEFFPLLVEKGSIAVNGTSLTAFDCVEDTFRVAIIPYTYEHTVFQYLQARDEVNLEFDIIGKYLQRQLQFLKR